MRLLVISGSRNPDGQTAKAAKALLEGVQCAGGTGAIAYLPTLSIERCRQCDARGWGKCATEGACVIEDDFASLVDAIRDADVVAFATPVYFADLSESLRAFTDRLRRVSRHSGEGNVCAGKTALGICVAGGGGGGAPDCCLSLEKVLGHCGFDIVDTVPVRRQNLEHKEEVLRSTGAWLVGNCAPRQ